MNEEQLKKLKEGDEIFIRARYKKTYADGEVCFSISVTSVFGEAAKGEGHTIPGNVFLPSELQPAPKYDPCRLYKKGDRVSPQFCNGRKPIAYNGFINLMPEDGVYEVICDEDEDGDGIVRISYKAQDISICACFLELVTPVEEIEPYRIIEASHCFEVRRKEPDDDRGTGYERYVSIFFFSHPPYTRTKEAARAAAEAECARLNAEHRKDQTHGNQ